ncbi:ketopantoate reductase family protein [Diaminobutyricibacter tongyongensis]|uniref:2-dehydropantoate 2-reductase n=1 Tax=Leifsonia tongyongensis TaxID=1268043 RepID=A0A6L9Y1I1_9MICO|nr:2-dehydropantoate 2-reductase [Diaminobutyricibacter tongyongensis]NEN07436.1 ketopantoate reductase family protein [Diaminobutyricibacter tongyongensis]
MRIGVIGAGAIGGTIAALLDRSGHDVEVTARGEHLAAIRSTGLKLSGGWGTHTAHVAAAETLQRAPELAFVTTKAQDAAAAIREHTALLAGIPVVIVQNGLTGLDEASALLPDSDCVGALALWAASYLSPGSVSVTTPSTTYLGSGDGPPTAATLLVARVLGAVMPCQATDNFTGCQWTKLMVNQINAMPAITGLSAQETLADRHLRLIVTASLREAVRVAISAGVHFGSLQGLTDPILRFVARSPLAVAQVVPLLMKRRMGRTPNPGSTLQSIRRGQPTEIDYLNGAVVDQAARLGIHAPINAALVGLVHRVEHTGEFVTPAEVITTIAPLL